MTVFLWVVFAWAAFNAFASIILLIDSRPASVGMRAWRLASFGVEGFIAATALHWVLM